MALILPYRQIGPYGETEFYPKHFDGYPLKPPADAWYGIDSRLNLREYWPESFGLDLSLFVPIVIRDGQYLLGPEDPLLWCPPESSARIKNIVFSFNKERMTLVLEALREYQTFSQTPQFVINKVRSQTIFVPMTGGDLNISHGLANALQKFFNKNGRTPQKIFSDYNGDPRLPAPDFERDSLGIKCPTWAALGFFTSDYSTTEGGSAGIVLTDDGPRFASEYEYRRFCSSFWFRVTNKIKLYVPAWSNAAGTEYVGTNWFKIMRPAWMGDFITHSPNNQIWLPDLPRDLVNGVAEFYDKALFDISKQTADAYNKNLIFDILGTAGFMFGLPSMLTSVGAFLSGQFSFSNLLATVKFADKIGIVEADKFLALANLGDSLYSLSQSAIDNFKLLTFDESPALDIADTAVYSDPVLPAPAPVPAVPEVPTIPSTPMDNFFDPSFDWGNIPSGSGFGVELDSTIWDNFDLDFSFVDSFNVDLTSFDWGLSPDLGISPMIDAFTESGGVFDFSALGNAWGISLDGFMTEDLFVPPTTDLFELAANAPGLSAQQFAYATGSSIAEAGAVETIVSNAESSGDFWGTFDGMLKSTTAAIGALAKLYISYKTAEAQISAVAGKTGNLPTTSSRPTRPGQIVRQPDGSISIMDANGNVQTIRPNGSTQTTAPNQQLPTFSNLFSKQNLMIGGAALAAGVLVFLSTKRK